MPAPAINLAGQRFGSWIVLQRSSHKRRRLHEPASWLCRCDCGKEKDVLGNTLRNKTSRSCGCMKGLLANNCLRPYEVLYRVFLRTNIKRKKIDLTYEEFEKFTEIDKCHYCNRDIEWPEHHFARKMTRYNLDRKDNSLGYSVNNCVVCCPECNWMKGNRFSYEEWVCLAKALRNFRDAEEQGNYSKL